MWFVRYARRDFLRTAMVAAAGFDGQRVALGDGETWLDGLHGTHRAFFDVAAVRAGILGRVDNFLNVYRDEYRLGESHVNVLFGAHSAGLSFVLNDAMWARYELGALYNVVDSRTRAPALRNPFATMDASNGWPTDYSITTLQRRGVRFLACRGSMRNLARQFAGKGEFGNADTIFTELEANLLPNVTPVPAMIVAQNRAQEVGLKYVYVI